MNFLISLNRFKFFSEFSYDFERTVFEKNYTLYNFRVGGGTLPWATPCLEPSRFFLNKKKINILRLEFFDFRLK